MFIMPSCVYVCIHAYIHVLCIHTHMLNSNVSYPDPRHFDWSGVSIQHILPMDPDPIK
jgi:hypothetical protein